MPARRELVDADARPRPAPRSARARLVPSRSTTSPSSVRSIGSTPGSPSSTAIARSASAGSASPTSTAPPVPDDLLDGALRDLLALGHDDDVAAGLLDLRQQVAGDDHRAAGRGVGAQHLAHGVDLRRVEPVGRLVEHQQVGQAEHRLGDRHPLPHALAVAAHPLVDRRARARRPRSPPRGARRRAAGRSPPSTGSGCRGRTGAAAGRCPRRTSPAGTAPARPGRPRARRC